MANERHVYVIGDYVQTNQEAKRLLENTLTASASIQSYELNRKQVLEKHRRVDLLSSTSLCVFTFPRQERYLIYDRDDPVNSYYNEIHTLNEEKGMNLLVTKHRNSRGSCLAPNFQEAKLVDRYEQFYVHVSAILEAEKRRKGDSL